MSDAIPNVNALSVQERALLALTLVPGLGPRLLATLLERFGSAERVLAAPLEQLRQVPYFSSEVAAQFAAVAQSRNVDTECTLMAQFGVRLLTRGSADYPALLAEIASPPPLLYCRGAVTERDRRAVAIVGARNCTHYGRRVTEQLAGGLARAGWTVVSGLARGIDGVAHRAALAAGGRTLAVLAGGLSKIYPPEHAELAKEVAGAGALLCEVNMRMEPMAGMFPARNRIISGLSRAVVIVEAAEKSGALITADHAAEQGRTVLAVPGPVDSAASGGTNALIRNGAILIRGVDDILEELSGLGGMFHAADRQAEAAAPPVPAALPPDLDDQQLKLWHFLDEPRHIDDIALRLDLEVAPLSTLLMQLELKRVVRRLPGNRYQRG
ncbi:MAG: DNA-processing protein DprA [Gemmataceae bacterium]